VREKGSESCEGIWWAAGMGERSFSIWDSGPWEQVYNIVIERAVWTGVA